MQWWERSDQVLEHLWPFRQIIDKHHKTAPSLLQFPGGILPQSHHHHRQVKTESVWLLEAEQGCFDTKTDGDLNGEHQKDLLCSDVNL